MAAAFRGVKGSLRSDGGSVPEPRRSGRAGAPPAVPGGPARQRPPGGSRLPRQRGALAAGGLPAGDRLPACARRIHPGPVSGPGGYPDYPDLPDYPQDTYSPRDTYFSGYPSMPDYPPTPDYPAAGGHRLGRLSTQRIPGRCLPGQWLPARGVPGADQPPGGYPARRIPGGGVPGGRRRLGAGGCPVTHEEYLHPGSVPAGGPDALRLPAPAGPAAPGAAPDVAPGPAQAVPRAPAGPCSATSGAVLRRPGAAGHLPDVPAPVTLAPGARGPGGQRLGSPCSCTNCPPRSSARCWCSISPGRADRRSAAGRRAVADHAGVPGARGGGGVPRPGLHLPRWLCTPLVR